MDFAKDFAWDFVFTFALVFALYFAFAFQKVAKPSHREPAALVGRMRRPLPGQFINNPAFDAPDKCKGI